MAFRRRQWAVRFLSLSLFLGTLTQFRVFSVGVSELLALFGIMLSAPSMFSPSLRTHAAIMMLGALAIIFLGVGTIWGAVLGVDGQSLRDFGIWIYIILFIWSLAALFHGSELALITLVNWVAVAPLLLMAILAIGVVADLPVWFSDESGDYIPFVSRFVGFSNNPNQLGFALCSVPFLILFAKTRSQKTKRFAVILNLSFLSAIFIASMVRSNTVFVAWGVGFGFMWILATLRNGIRSPAKVFFLIILGFFALYVGLDFFIGQTTKGDDASGRYAIWASFPETFEGSPLFGYGPGSYGGVNRPFGGWEFHSLPLDILSQGGSALGSVFLISILSSAYLGLRSGSGLVCAIMISAMVEMLMHNSQRHPIFWFYLFFPAFYFLSGIKPRALSTFVRGSNVLIASGR